MSRLGKTILLLIILFIGGLIVLKSIEYYTPNFERGYLTDKKEIFNGVFKYGLYAHIITVPLILLTGSSQVFLRYEGTKKNLHRTLGSIYAYLILFISAPGAFIISFYAFGGWYSRLSFFTLTILWSWFTYKGLINGKRGNMIAHKNYMIRSYILTLSAISLRIISFIFIHYFNFHGERAYSLSAWLSWLPFLIVTEIFIKESVDNRMSKNSIISKDE